MKKRGVLFLVLAILGLGPVHSQVNYAKNIKKSIVQGDIMFIAFDIEAIEDASSFTVELIPVFQGQRIKVTEAFGDVGKNIEAGKREIVWYYSSDFTGDIHMVDVSITAFRDGEPSVLAGVVTFPSNYKKHKTMKQIWLGASVATAAVGTFAVIRSNSLYNDYQTAREDAEDIRKQFETMDIVAPVAFIVSGICVSQVIIQAKKQKRAQQKLSMQLMPLHDGAVVGLRWTF
jgi:hypothetical protein